MSGLRRTKGLKRGTTPLKRSPIRSVSRKRARAYGGRDGRRAFVARILADRPYCQIKVPGVCTLASTQVHEPLRRSAGGAITDPDNALAVCHNCHRYAHDNVAEAYEKGWLVRKFGGNG